MTFSQLPFSSAVRRIAELEFARLDIGIAEGSAHFTPQDLLLDQAAVVQQIRSAPTMAYTAITLRSNAFGDTLLQQVSQASRLAKQLAAPYLVVSAGPMAVPFDEEVRRLIELERACALHGTILTVVTQIGTWTELPASTVELCKAVPGLAVTLDPTHLLCGPNQGRTYTSIYPFVRHVQLRDSGKSPDQLQVTVGRGEIEYGKILNALRQIRYGGTLVVAIEDTLAPADMDVTIEARKLRLLLESLL